MMKKFNNKKISTLIFFFVSLHLISQAPATLFFMKNVPYRHTLNPSLQPVQDFYVSLPVIGYTHLNTSNSSLTVQDVLYNDKNGNTIFFLNPAGDKDKFYSTLKPVTNFNADLKLNLFGAGMRFFDDYLSIEISKRFNSQTYVPKDVFKLLLYGTPSINENSYNLKKFAFDTNVFTDVSLGYAHTNDKRLFLGGKIKLLFGNNNKSFSHSDLNLSADIEKWNLNGTGVLNSSGGDKLDIVGNFDQIKYTSNGMKSIFSTAGFGVGLDLGMSYRLNKTLTVSASIMDLGFINWTKNASNTAFRIDYNYTGVLKQLSDGKALQTLLDSVKQALANAKEVTKSNKTYQSYLSPTLNLGVEQQLLKNSLTLGLYSSTSFSTQKITQEVTLSLNAQPAKWLDTSLSYSLLKGRLSSFGAGVGLHTGPLYWFTSLDYLGSENVPIPINKIDSALPKITFGIPYKTKAFNVAFGITYVMDDLNWFKSITPSPFYDENRREQSNKRGCNCDW